MFWCHKTKLAVYLLGLCFVQVCLGSPECRDDRECGWNSQCTDGACNCVTHFTISNNGRDCYDSRCIEENCVDCTNEGQCRRCVNYIEEGSAKCLKECETAFTLIIEGEFVGKVCKASHIASNKMYLAVIISCCAAVLLLICVSLIVYWRLRTLRERDMRIKMMAKMMDKERSERLKSQSHDNIAFDATDGHSPRRMNQREIEEQIQRMQEHVDTYLAMRKETSIKQVAPDVSPQHLAKYKKLEKELGRVLTLLLDPDAEFPDDADTLLQWAEHIRKQYLRTNTRIQPVSTHSTITSTFRPDHMILTDDTSDTQVNKHTIKYERFPDSEYKGDREVSEIGMSQLLDDSFTEPIDV